MGREGQTSWRGQIPGHMSCQQPYCVSGRMLGGNRYRVSESRQCNNSFQLLLAIRSVLVAQSAQKSDFGFRPWTHRCKSGLDSREGRGGSEGLVGDEEWSTPVKKLNFSLEMASSREFRSGNGILWKPGDEQFALTSPTANAGGTRRPVSPPVIYDPAWTQLSESTALARQISSWFSKRLLGSEIEIEIEQGLTSH